jgi:hypothetical protein
VKYTWAARYPSDGYPEISTLIQRFEIGSTTAQLLSGFQEMWSPSRTDEVPGDKQHFKAESADIYPVLASEVMSL